MTHQDRRTFVVVANVLLFHAMLLWALQSGLLKRAVELVVPVQMLGEFIERLAPAPAPPAPPAVVKPSVARSKAPSAPTLPQPVAVQKDTEAPQSWVIAAVPLETSSPRSAITASVAAVAPAPPAAPSVELPSSDADYLQNPKPIYPAASKRLGEQGVVIHSVQIGADGFPISARLVRSSGFHRLDQASLTAVMRWRYSPGKRNGLPTAMSFNVPINWVLE
ncbi:energy transducer TonB [Rhodoferax antarcticus]|uniref:TonB family C-terminal domain protein n=1 Tax=Rhodoferax antarcticus ANT.BR TaxID=1111071 RepID=A0A1Q8YC66_9BURK|nr:energy transducer TonB [Rhodoferax antarcticus]APW46581.1 hypothetical protein RA876_09605 [Rhodoferax antarcticus]OLP05644.1 tonB family C-terminal domain protein [Rhodoferax antarcticus ANT.BR]